MARRSFNPASSLAEPAFIQSSSSSSFTEDSLLETLKGMSVEHIEDQMKNKENLKISDQDQNISSTSESFLEKTTIPSRKRSDPIAIQLPTRNPRTVYTPLSARGDLPGGYFPNHEEIQRSYKSHPFHDMPESRLVPNPVLTFDMSPFGTPSSDAATPRGQPILSPGFPPEILQMPLGKYHPSNYKVTANSSMSTTTVNRSVPTPFPAHNLAIPKSAGKRNTANRPGHDRQGSDVKRKLQQYQRDMIAQSRMAGVAAGGSSKPTLKEPNSPKLIPCSSPGPITPFELEESSGYMVAAGLRSGNSGSQRQEELEVIERLMEMEDQRASNPEARF